jgi:hypothetical protein
MWHPRHAARALDLLWSLEVDGPGQRWSSDPNPITAMAEAAGFDLQRQDTSAAAVMDWLEAKLTLATAVERARRQPWILSAVLKPFFARELGHGRITSRTLHLSTVTLSVSRTRPLRRRALAIVDRFVNADDPALASALVPILREAVCPFSPKFSREVSAADHAAWRQDRLEVVKVIERTVETHRDSPALLVQLGRILRDRSDDDPDPPVKEACEEVVARFPDTFELRVARFLTSLAYKEFRIEPGADFKSARIRAERKWEEFGRRVAREVIARFPSPAHVCEFVRRQLRDLKDTSSTVSAGTLMGLIAEISSEWCSGLLDEMIDAEETSLDAFLQPVIREASVHAVEAYRKALDVLPTRGRSNR